MIIREALPADIPQIQYVRSSVRENILSNPALVTDADVLEMITQRGKGWVCEVDGKIVGFSIVDLTDKNIWALFLLPDHEMQGKGKALHHPMLDFAFSQPGINYLWLSTSPGTRAEGFYPRFGWRKTGMTEKGEVRFEMEKEEWYKRMDNGHLFH